MTLNNSLHNRRIDPTSSFLCCIVHIYPPFTRKRVVLLYFVREVSIRLGVAIFEMSGPPGFHIKVGGIPLSAFPKTQQVNLPACSPQPPLNAGRQSGKLWITFSKVSWYDSTRGMNPKSNDCEADALTTIPTRLL